jgi:uncharacterized protein YdhG (YjbR/CyaY superfamily)
MSKDGVAAEVDEYISQAPNERRDALNMLRQLCREELPGFAEAMRYGMPTYLRGDVTEVSFASQKNYISLYVPRAVLQANAKRLIGLSTGKSCIRFRRVEQVDPATVRALLSATARGTANPAD